MAVGGGHLSQAGSSPLLRLPEGVQGDAGPPPTPVVGSAPLLVEERPHLEAAAPLLVHLALHVLREQGGSQRGGGREDGLRHQLQRNRKKRRLDGCVCVSQAWLRLLLFSSLTCVTEYGPKEARRPGLGTGPSGSGGSTKRLCEEEKGLELEKMGPRSACDRGRRSQEGGTTSMSTGRDSGRGRGRGSEKAGWGRDRDTERVGMGGD